VLALHFQFLSLLAFEMSQVGFLPLLLFQFPFEFEYLVELLLLLQFFVLLSFLFLPFFLLKFKLVLSLAEQASLHS